MESSPIDLLKEENEMLRTCIRALQDRNVEIQQQTARATNLNRHMDATITKALERIAEGATLGAPDEMRVSAWFNELGLLDDVAVSPKLGEPLRWKSVDPWIRGCILAAASRFSGGPSVDVEEYISKHAPESAL